MKTINLTLGKSAIVNDGDYKKLASYCWYFNRHTGYAFRRISTKAGEKQRKISMHRQIMGLFEGDGKIIDHKNRNKLDNRKKNLRIVTQSENCLNSDPRTNNVSGYVGVNLIKRKSKTTLWTTWRAYVTINGKQFHLGYYKDIKEAVKARVKYFQKHNLLI